MPARTSKRTKKKPAAKKRAVVVREPAVAGIFYPEHKEALAALIDRLADKSSTGNAVAVIVPHGGYETAGRVAAASFRRAGNHAVAVVVGPKHTRAGKPFSVAPAGAWQTPLGKLKVHPKLAEALLEENRGLLEEDAAAHKQEHSIEVLLPMLQRLSGGQWVAPVLVSDDEAVDFQALGEGIARAVKKVGENLLLVASVDLTRFEPQAAAKEKDAAALKALLALDGPGLVGAARELAIPLCGLQAAGAVIAAAKALGATHSELVAYQTSGDATGEFETVTGYAGITIQ
jgi:AmmeMemoRadiSam system protein B